MTTRKTVGWLVFAVLMVVLILEAPGVAASACYRAGLKFYSAGKYQAAATAFKGVVMIKPGFASGHLELGYSYLALKKYALAEKAYLDAKRLNDDAWAACGLGMTYHKWGRHDDAEKEFQRAMRLDSNYACPYAQSGTMYYQLGRYKEAIEAFKRAATLYPCYETYEYLGNSYVFARDYEPAIEAYKKAIQINPKNESAHYQLGIAYDYLQRYEESVKEYNEVLKTDPDDEGTRYYLAIAYAALHNKAAALEQYEILRKSNKGSAAELWENINLAANRQKGKEKLYFVPLSNFSAASLTKLANSVKQKTGINVIVTQPVPFALTTVDKRRAQVVAEEAINLMRVRYPDLVSDPNAIVIGLTDEDLFIRTENDQYAFCYRMLERFAVVSSARMNPANLGGSANDLLTEARMRKMLLKNIGILYYRLPVNHDPTSVLYEDVDEVADLDKMREDF
ncbi:MAG TPA: tetratricopeptide repeat protein [Pyrinomonadaceae bacterium]|nr:tetratricopeptide repeat protein [Pyrinomonadaceae bacterium]